MIPKKMTKKRRISMILSKSSLYLRETRMMRISRVRSSKAKRLMRIKMEVKQTSKRRRMMSR